MRSRKAAMWAEVLVFLAAALLLGALCAVAAHAQMMEEKADPTITITFSENGVTVNPADPYAVWVEPEINRVTILKKGNYLLTGTSEDGQVVVLLSKKKKVELELAGLDLQSSRGPAIWVRSADKAVITLAGKTVNRLADSMNYESPASDDEDVNACLYADCDLEIKGSGALSVEGSYRNGIRSHADLKIKKSTVVVSAPYVGLRANTVDIDGATVELNCYTYGVLAKAKSEERGWLRAERSSLMIEAGMVGIRTSGDLEIAQSCMAVINSETPVECGGVLTVPDMLSADGEDTAAA